MVHDKEESQFLSDITDRVDGQQVPVEDVSSLSDHAKIKKVEAHVNVVVQEMVHSSIKVIVMSNPRLKAKFREDLC